MAKITSTNVSSGFNTTINTNFSAIDDELNNKVLYRNNPTGEPNTMLNDLDMNSNDILNANAIGTSSLSVNGSNITSSDSAVSTLPDQSSQSGKFLTTDGATASWNVINIGGNITIDSAQTGELSSNTYWAIAATAPRTRNLPTAPADGDEITIFFASGDARANNATIGRNGKLIDNIAADKVLTIDCIQKLKYDDAAGNWVSVLDTNRTLDGRIQDWLEIVHTMTTVAVDATNGTWQKRILAGNETFTFNIFGGQSVFVTVIPGANTLTLTNVDEWVGGAAPSIIEAEHLFIFWSDDGVTVSGLSVGGIS